MKVAPREIRERQESQSRDSFGYKPQVIWGRRERWREQKELKAPEETRMK